MKRVGLLGGTFDPPHIGHLVIAEEVRVALELEEIWFIPSQEPPHKNKAFSNASDRVEMVQKAISCNTYFKLNTIEVDRLGKSYTFDTVNILTSRHPEISFYFIIGADMVEYLPNWYRINELVRKVTFVGVKRIGAKLESSYPIKFVDIPYMEISSTMLRERLSKGQTTKYFIPDTVRSFIKEKQLYEKR